MSNVSIANVPNGLITKKHYEKSNEDKCNVRFKYAPSVGGGGYGVLQVPASSVQETSPKFSKVDLDADTRYPVYYTNADNQKRTHWAYGGEVKELFDKSRAPKQPSNNGTEVASTRETDIAPQQNDVTGYNDLDF